MIRKGLGRLPHEVFQICPPRYLMRIVILRGWLCCEYIAPSILFSASFLNGFFYFFSFLPIQISAYGSAL